MKNAFAAALFCLLAIPTGTTSAQGSKSIWAKTSKTLSQLLEEGAEIKAAMQGGMGAGGAWFLLHRSILFTNAMTKAARPFAKYSMRSSKASV